MACGWGGLVSFWAICPNVPTPPPPFKKIQRREANRRRHRLTEPTIKALRQTHLVWVGGWVGGLCCCFLCFQLQRHFF